jgi:hypothetical protein
MSLKTFRMNLKACMIMEEKRAFPAFSGDENARAFVVTASVTALDNQAGMRYVCVRNKGVHQMAREPDGFLPRV